MKSQKKTKILIVVDTMAIGGTERITAVLANSFIERGYTCGILVLLDDMSSLKYVNKKRVKTYTALRKFNLDPTYLLKVRRIVKGYKPDIILCQAFFSYFSIKIVTLFDSSIPVIISMHFTHYYKIKDKFFDLLYFNLLRLNSNRIIAIYKNQIEFFAQKYKISPKRFICIHNGIDTDYFKNTEMKKRENTLNIVHIANIREEKDQMNLLKALKLLNIDFKEWQLTFCGKDLTNLKSEFTNYIESSGLQSKIEFIDYVEDTRVVLKDADVFILSSKSEALPVSAMEAMSMGLPCILTAVGGCSDIIDDGINGFLVPPEKPEAIAEKLLFFNENKEKLLNMGSRAREKIVKKFSSDKMVDNYLNVFKKTLEKRQ